jgi:hypothetical protein
MLPLGGGSPSHHRTPLWVEVVGPATTARPWCDANREAGGTRRATAARPRGDANWEFGPPSLVLMGGARRASRAWPLPLPWSLPYPLPLGGGRRLSWPVGLIWQWEERRQREMALGGGWLGPRTRSAGYGPRWARSYKVYPLPFTLYFLNSNLKKFLIWICLNNPIFEFRKLTTTSTIFFTLNDVKWKSDEYQSFISLQDLESLFSPIYYFQKW